MSNPYGLSDEQMQAYAAQVAEERAARLRQRTPAEEQARYERIQAELKAILDAAATYHDPIAGLLAAQLYAERYTQNETAHAAWLEEQKKEE